MNGWPTVFLGVVAFATAAIAAAQIGLIVYAIRLARRLDDLSAQIERDVKPVLGTVNAIATSAARAASLAVAQIERADRVFADLAVRVDETASLIQSLLVAPAREGRALLAAVMAAIAAFRNLGGAPGARRVASDEEDPLFIG